MARPKDDWSDSEYPAVVLPLHTQHYVLLQPNLLYTAITRVRKLVVLVGSKKAIRVAVSRMDLRRRVTTLEGQGRRSLNINIRQAEQVNVGAQQVNAHEDDGVDRIMP